MVKRIQLTVDDDVFEKLKELKGDRSWEDFLVEAGINYVRPWERKDPKAEGRPDG